MKHRKNYKCCPGHSLNVSYLPSKSWFKFLNLSEIVNCVSRSLNHYIAPNGLSLSDAKIERHSLTRSPVELSWTRTRGPGFLDQDSWTRNRGQLKTDVTCISSRTTCNSSNSAHGEGGSDDKSEFHDSERMPKHVEMVRTKCLSKIGADKMPTAKKSLDKMVILQLAFYPVDILSVGILSAHHTSKVLYCLDFTREKRVNRDIFDKNLRLEAVLFICFEQTVSFFYSKQTNSTCFVKRCTTSRLNQANHSERVFYCVSS